MDGKGEVAGGVGLRREAVDAVCGRDLSAGDGQLVAGICIATNDGALQPEREGCPVMLVQNEGGDDRDGKNANARQG